VKERHVPIHLLVVEDELSMVLAMHDYFGHAGFHIDCAAGPGEAVRLLDAHAYDAVITDLHLTAERRAEGLAVAAYAREKNPSSFIVLLTGYDVPPTEPAAREAGIDIYETKPVELAQLAARIESALAARVAGAASAADRVTW
jgi:DNA-binding response OmpR family regulator